MLRRPRRLAVLAGLSLTAGLLPALAATPAVAVAPTGATVFLNEIHYDDAGTDAGELVEVAGPVGTSLAGWSVVLYNGATGAPYDTDLLAGSVPASGVVVVDYPVNGLQNGSPDGIALVDAGGAVVQFLSYEGAFTATGGPAAGLTSTDIGVSEIGEPDGQSLQLTGTGTGYGDFTWTGPVAATPGALNAGQSLVPPGGPTATCPEALTTEQGTAAQTDLLARDRDSRVVQAAITSGATPALSLALQPSATAAATATAVLSVDGSAPVGRYPVEVTFTTDDSPAETVTCTVTVVVTVDPDVDTPISTVQGPGGATPVAGQTVTVEGVVTSLFERGDVLDGYFVQEQDAQRDGDPLTAEGLFVFCGAGCPDLAAGDGVRVTGVAAERFGMTQLSATGATATRLLTRGEALPTPAPFALPAAGSTRAETTFERLEGMVVRSSTTLALSEYFELARYGTVTLTAGERPYQFTHANAPSTTGYSAHLAALAASRILLDDDNNDNNDAITGRDADEPYAFPRPGTSLTNRLRGGDTVEGLVGVMHWSFSGSGGTDAWRLRPVPEVVQPFTRVNERTAAPDEVGGRLKVGSFNVLNYFTTVDTTASSSSGPCGPAGTADCRGADSAAELARQQAKIVAALTAVDADVLGLIEIQNDADVSLARLVGALNAATGAGTYDYVRTGTLGTDAIKVALVYKARSVNPVGPYAVLDSSVDPAFVDTANRPALVQTFQQRRGGGRLTVAVNHLKSKGSGCAGDADKVDGAGNCDGTRTAAAQALARFLATDPTGSDDPDFLVVGDLNSYKRERPIEALKAEGFTDLIERFQGEKGYGYLFDGQLGYLDHALSSSTLTGQVTGATEWHVNADEAVELDYDDAVTDAPGEASFERRSAALPLYAPDPYRSSDHDAVVVGIDLVPGASPVRPGR